MIQNIYSLARDIKEGYERDDIDTVEGLSIDTYEILREVEFMTSGHYISGDYDENGDLKPFRDIVTRILENQRSAEEVDTKDMEITTDDPDYYVRASLVSKWNQDWMSRNHIDQFHNDAIETRGKTGGLLVKVIEEEDDLSLEVVDWNGFSGDAADLAEGMKVIPHFYTPSQLLKIADERGWDVDKVKEAIELYAEADQDEDMKIQRQTTGEYILVQEVSGVMSRTYMDDDADEHDYSFQVHYVAGAEFHSDDEENPERGVTLDSKEHDENIFYYLPYKKRTTSGKTLGIGMVERARHAQMQTNTAAQHYKYALDFASTHVLQSSSKNLKGKNVLTNMKRGSIIKTDDGKPISGVDMSPQALAYLDNYLAGWQDTLDRATGTYNVGTGEELPSGTPYRLGAILDQNAQSQFDLRREEYAIFLNRIYKERVIPFFIRQMKNQKKLTLQFSPEEIKQLDKDVSTYKADKAIVEKYLNGGYADVPPVMRFAVMDTEREEMLADIDKSLKRNKNRRTITMFPEGYWQGIEDKLYVDITGERRDKGTVLESVTNVLMQYLQFKPQLDADPEARRLFNQIVESAGLEPVNFAESAPQQQQAPNQKPQTGQTPIDNPEQLSAKPK